MRVGPCKVKKVGFYIVWCGVPRSVWVKVAGRTGIVLISGVTNCSPVTLVPRIRLPTSEVSLCRRCSKQPLGRSSPETLFDIRKSGVEMITCYRTAEFIQYCKTYSRRSDISHYCVLGKGLQTSSRPAFGPSIYLHGGTVSVVLAALIGVTDRIYACSCIHSQ